MDHLTVHSDIFSFIIVMYIILFAELENCSDVESDDDEEEDTLTSKYCLDFILYKS